MITKKALYKKLDRFSLDTEFDLVKCDNFLCLIVKESGEVIDYVKEIDTFKCPSNTLDCGKGYACDACPYNEELK